MPGIPIICHGCGTRAMVNRVTASLRCTCGSADLDLDDDLQTTASEHVAYPHGPGTGWGNPQDLTRGWSDYEGPLPSPNPVGSPPVNDSMRCPSCHGSGYDVQDKTLCRECNGAGVVKRSTGQPDVESNDATTGGPPVGGARWQGATGSYSSGGGGGRTVQVFAASGGGGGSGGTSQVVAARPSHPDTAEYQNIHGAPGYGHVGPTGPHSTFNPENEKTFYEKGEHSPGVRYRDERDYSKPTGRPYLMEGATCPNCGHAPTELRKDRNEDAWWHCPGCGSLANIDAHPEVNPYGKNPGMVPDRSMKTGKKLLGRTHKTGRLLAIVATVQKNNTVSLAEALWVARNTLITYPEDRS
jgi:hypothetical protein